MKANIPDDWNGTDWTSKCIQWPDSPLWISILYGLINMVSRGRNWTNDSGTIKDAIEVGNEIWARFQASEGCDSFMDVRQNPDNPCRLDKNSGGGWVQFADLTLCGGAMFEDPPYGGPDFTLSEDTCLVATIIGWEYYTILLELNTQRASATSEQDMFFRVLSALATKIAVPNVNQLLALSSALWAGSNAGFAESFITAFREDLVCELLSALPALSGEALFIVFQEARDTIASFVATYEFEGSIPGLAEHVCLYLVQAMHTSDFMLMYYQSDIETADCDYCTDVWCFEFDFEVSDGGWEVMTNRPYGEWVDGVGWRSTWGGGGPNNQLYIMREFADTQVTRVIVRGYTTASPQYGQVAMNGWLAPIDLPNDTPVFNDSVGVPGAQTFEIDWDGAGEIDTLGVIGPGYQYSYQYCIVSSILIMGTGTNPFGEDNCT